MDYTSNCCDAFIINGDICSDCKEHCDAVDNTESDIEGDDDKPGDFTAYFNKEQLIDND